MDKMKITKGDIIFWSTIILIVCFFGFLFYTSMKTDMQRLNICSKIYGYKEQGVFGWEGTMNLNYTGKYFNETHIACCKKVKFIDLSGQIQHLNCTGVYTRP